MALKYNSIYVLFNKKISIYFYYLDSSIKILTRAISYCEAFDVYKNVLYNMHMMCQTHVLTGHDSERRFLPVDDCSDAVAQRYSTYQDHYIDILKLSFIRIA